VVWKLWCKIFKLVNLLKPEVNGFGSNYTHFNFSVTDGKFFTDKIHTMTFEVTAVDDAPTVLNPITDVNVDEDAANTVIDITNVFTDIDNDIASIVKSVFLNDNTGLVTATIVDNQLTLDYQDNKFGTANLTIRGHPTVKLLKILSYSQLTPSMMHPHYNRK